MAFGFLGRRRRGPRRDRSGSVDAGARTPNERDQTVQVRPVAPRTTIKRAARDLERGREDTEARWAAGRNLSGEVRENGEKPARPILTRRRFRG